jgi:hypothetical protein
VCTRIDKRQKLRRNRVEIGILRNKSVKFFSFRSEANKLRKIQFQELFLCLDYVRFLQQHSYIAMAATRKLQGEQKSCGKSLCCENRIACNIII